MLAGMVFQVACRFYSWGLQLGLKLRHLPERKKDTQAICCK